MIRAYSPAPKYAMAVKSPSVRWRTQFTGRMPLHSRIATGAVQPHPFPADGPKRKPGKAYTRRHEASAAL